MATKKLFVNLDLLNASRISNALDPATAQDYATMNWVNNQLYGLNPKQAVKAVSTSDIASLTGTPTIDGYATQIGDRVLLTGQSTSSQNGIWVVASSTWTRPNDFATGSNQSGAYTEVAAGTVYTGTVWGLKGGTETVDTTAETWANQRYSLTQKITGTIGDGASTTLSVVHNLGAIEHSLTLRDASTNVELEAQVTYGANTDTVTTNSAPASNGIAYVVLG